MEALRSATWILRAANNRPQINQIRGKVDMKDLFNDIVRYGVFMADYEFVDNEGEAVRIRVARYLLRMYFIVQRGGEIVELHQI